MDADDQWTRTEDRAHFIVSVPLIITLISYGALSGTDDVGIMILKYVSVSNCARNLQ